MFLRKLFGMRPKSAIAASRAQSIIREATRPVMEYLEGRTLLSTVTYYAPGGTTLITLKGTANYGEVQVLLGSSTTPAYTFTGTTDTDKVVGAVAGATCIQMVPIASMPSGGIFYAGTSGDTLKVQAAPLDQEIDLTSSTSTGGTVTTVDATDSASGTTTYDAGVTHLIIRTNDVVGASSADGTIVNVPELHSGTSLMIETGAGTYDTINLGAFGIGETVVGAVIHAPAGHNTVNLYTDGDDPTTATVDLGASTGNTLNVYADATATLAETGGSSHIVVVDNVNVYSAGNFIVADPSTIGDIEVTGGNATIAAASTITTFGVDSSSTAYIQAPSTIGTLTVAGAAHFSGASDGSTVGTFNLTGAAYLEGSWKTLNVTALSITSDGILDIGKNTVLVDDTATPLATIKSYWQAGYNYDSGAGYGNWDGASGARITSSEAIADNVTTGNGTLKRTIGYIDGAAQNTYSFDLHNDLGGPVLATNRILIRPVLVGNLTFDSVVDANDIGLIIGLGYFGGSTAPDGWIDGDLNGDGVVDANDIGLIIGAGTFGVGSYGPP